MSVKSSDIVAALRLRYSPPEWAGFAELRDGTGTMHNRSIDFWALNCFPSKGFTSVAVEIKVARSDFIRELDNPTKRRPMEANAVETWFATPPGLIQPSELPEGWGLLEYLANGTVRAKHRARQRAQPEFKTAFVASVLRRAFKVEDSYVSREQKIAELEAKKTDLQKFLDGKAAEFWEKARPRFERDTREAIHLELYGEKEYSELMRILRTEYGYGSANSNVARLVIDLIGKAKEGKLREIGGEEIVRSLKGLRRSVDEALGKLSAGDIDSGGGEG